MESTIPKIAFLDWKQVDKLYTSEIKLDFGTYVVVYDERCKPHMQFTYGIFISQSQSYVNIQWFRPKVEKETR